MKNFTLTLAFASVVASGAAQEVAQPSKFSVETNGFGSNWFVDLGLGYNAAYTSQEHGVTANPFSHKRGSWGVNAAVGKWFSPEIGLRMAGEFGWTKNTSGSRHFEHPATNYMHLHGDVLLNLTNILKGYEAERFWNMSPYAGLGMIRNFDDNVNKLAVSVGVHNTFRLTSRLNAFADLQMLMTNSGLLGPKGNNGSSILAFNHYDKIASVKMGVSYNLSRNNTWRKSADLAELVNYSQERMAYLNDLVENERSENERLRRLLAEHKAAVPQPHTSHEPSVVVEKEIMTTPFSVFFNFESDKIASRKDLVDLKEVANFAKAHGRQLLISGYADSQTGTANYNHLLSEKRAQTIVNELVRMGFPREHITLKAVGGVDTLSPKSFNRRVTVMIQ